ncbi:MAG: hypothetical protein J5608_01455 [Alphaproteobacteria bacterium]|nr:hypothetical protein [Alphaproteobacteria bacterium]
MADNNIPNKLDSVKHEIKQQLFFECVIDSNNNILNLPKYQAIVDKLIQNREAEVRKNSSIDGVPLDREVVSVLMGEIAYLNEIKLHRHNLDTMKEHPMTDRVDLDEYYTFKNMFQDVARFARKVSTATKKHFQR